MARAAPIQCGLFVVCPVVLAAVQLLNSFVNGLTLAASVPFALAMVAFAVLFVRHARSVIRLRRLEGNAPRADVAPSD